MHDTQPSPNDNFDKLSKSELKPFLLVRKGFTMEFDYEPDATLDNQELYRQATRVWAGDKLVKNRFGAVPAPNTLKYDDYDRREHKVRFYDSALHGQVKHHTVKPCGHDFVAGSEPRHRNCASCWFTFFTVYGELTREADELFRSAGEGALVQVRGRTFTSNFTKYMSTLAQWKQEADAAKAAEEQKDEVCIR